MAASYVLRLAKLKGSGKILAAARHNKRKIQNELGADSHIDATKMRLNYCLAGASTPEEIAAEAKAMMLAAGYEKPRKDFVAAIEVVYSLPAINKVNTEAFFADCLDWTRSHFGCHILSFDVHLDESTPHAHALLLPLINGRLQGSDLAGNQARFRTRQNLFYAQVGIKHGLSKPVPRLSGKAKATTERNVLNELKNDPVMRSAIWPRIRDEIRSDPAPYASVLGVEIPAHTPKKSSVQIMTSKGKGKNYE